jgi:RNA polymerase sigma-70 factor (family 1)
MISAANVLPNERELFARMAKGDEAAFADIFFHYIPFLQPHIFKMTRSEEVTQDIIHDTFLRLWIQREKLAAVENFRSYIYTISTNKTYDWLKKTANEKKAIAAAHIRNIGYANITEETIDFNQSAEFINQAVAKLPPQRKLVFKLSREEGLSHDEIAEKLNISKNTVSNHLTEALRSIKEYLQKIPGTTGPALLSIVIATKIF